MPHDSAGMSVVQHPSKGLGEVIGKIDDTRDKFHDNCARILPILYNEVLDINVTRALSRHTSVDHIDGQLVVAAHDGRALRRKAEVSHDGSHVSSVLRGGNYGKELCFG